MYATVVVVMCKLLVSPPTLAPDGDCTAEETRVEEIVTDTDLDSHVDFFGCMIDHQMGAATWKAAHPIYGKRDWRIARIKCVPGHYEVKGRV